MNLYPAYLKSFAHKSIKTLFPCFFKENKKKNNISKPEYPNPFECMNLKPGEKKFILRSIKNISPKSICLLTMYRIKKPLAHFLNPELYRDIPKFDIESFFFLASAKKHLSKAVESKLEKLKKNNLTKEAKILHKKYFGEEGLFEKASKNLKHRNDLGKNISSDFPNNMLVNDITIFLLKYKEIAPIMIKKIKLILEKIMILYLLPINSYFSYPESEIPGLEPDEAFIKKIKSFRKKFDGEKIFELRKKYFGTLGIIRIMSQLKYEILAEKTILHANTQKSVNKTMRLSCKERIFNLISLENLTKRIKRNVGIFTYADYQRIELGKRIKRRKKLGTNLLKLKKKQFYSDATIKTILP